VARVVHHWGLSPKAQVRRTVAKTSRPCALFIRGFAGKARGDAHPSRDRAEEVTRLEPTASRADLRTRRRRGSTWQAEISTGPGSFLAPASATALFVAGAAAALAAGFPVVGMPAGSAGLGLDLCADGR